MIRLYLCLALVIKLPLIQTLEDLTPIPVTTARSGDTVHLQCLRNNLQKTKSIFWVKQSIGYMMRSVASKKKFHEQTSLNPSEKSQDSRFSVNTSTWSLTIRSVNKADEAAYHCLLGSLYDINDINGTSLAVKEFSHQRSNYQVMLQPPASKSLNPRDSVDLQCSVLSQTCPGEHSVHWFRAGSGQSHPGIIYTNGNRSDECGKKLDYSSSTQSCTYSLPIKRFSSSDAGTYYCAVAICGEILFGNGITHETSLKSVVVGLGIALIGCGIVILILTTIIIIRSRKTLCEHCKDTIKSPKCLPRGNSTAEQVGDADMLNYAALKFSDRKSRERKTREPQHESVYSAVRS